MPESNDDDTTSRRRKKLFRLTRRPAASWSERASNEASSALAPAPGVAEDKAERQGRPSWKRGWLATLAGPQPTPFLAVRRPMSHRSSSSPPGGISTPPPCPRR